jgi:hypothetical protein
MRHNQRNPAMMIKTGLGSALLMLASAAHANPPYKVPEGEPGQLAYITGDMVATAKGKPVKVYVWGIDRKEVKSAARHWNKPVPVTPGMHRVTVAIKGVYEEFDIDFCAGCSFQAHATYSETSSGMMIKISTSEFWITRQPDGEAITPRKTGKPIPVRVRFTTF